MGYESLCSENQFKLLVCPSNSTDTKLVSRYLQNIFNTRDKIDQNGRVGETMALANSL